MRTVPDEPLSEWTPPSYTVDGYGKVRGAQPGSPNNWGRWGELAEDCANDGAYEFLLAASPVPIVKAVGSPLNPLAIK
jgi:hypothetical protein